MSQTIVLDSAATADPLHPIFTIGFVTSAVASSLVTRSTEEFFVFQLRLELAIQYILIHHQRWKEDGVPLFLNGLTDSLAILKL